MRACSSYEQRPLISGVPPFSASPRKDESYHGMIPLSLLPVPLQSRARFEEEQVSSLLPICSHITALADGLLGPAR